MLGVLRDKMTPVLRLVSLASGASPSGLPKVARRFASHNFKSQKAKRHRAGKEREKCAAIARLKIGYDGKAMIVKKIKHANDSKPKEWQIGDLVDYISKSSDEGASEKVEYSRGINFITETYAGQKMEMSCLAWETVRSKMPVSHWMFSWPESEQPTHEQVDELVNFFLREMGLEGHQAIYALHCDTRNYHVHIAVNRVHPETLKVVRTNNGFDIRQAHKVRAMIEKMQGWAPLENSPFVVTEENEIAERIVEKDLKLSPKAVEFEIATGEKSAQRIAQERGHEIIKNANTWGELHNGLKETGLRFEKKGSGGIILVGDIAVKASSVDRSFSMGKLVKRLGEYQPGDYSDTPQKIESEPLNQAIAADVQVFSKATRELASRKKENSEREKEEREELLARQKQERETKLGNIARKHPFLLGLARYFLTEQQKKEREDLRDRQVEERPSFARPKFNQWLLRRGKYLAEAFISVQEGHKGNMAQNSTPEIAQIPQAKAFLEYAKASNADRYRVTAIKMDDDGSRKVFILDKKDVQSMGFTPDEIVRKMPEIVKLQKRGENIYYTPLSQDRHHILIDDVTPENVVRLQKDGYRPAAIIESSPGNYQCVLTFPKFGGEFDRQIANHLAVRLNREYGDPKLSGAIHAHRAPGFENRKTKHRQKDGKYPLCVLRHAVQQFCKKALVEARKIEMALQEKVKQRYKPTFTAIPQMGPQAAYFAHYENIRSHITIEDFSRVDAMIVLRMRANGHPPEAVLSAIRDCAPKIRDEKQKQRDWQRYAERTVEYAFGYVGDRDLITHSHYRAVWLKIENGPSQQKYRSRL